MRKALGSSSASAIAPLNYPIRTSGQSTRPTKPEIVTSTGSETLKRHKTPRLTSPIIAVGKSMTERAQEELNRLGQMGWELVSSVQSSAADAIRLFLKKPA